VQVDERCATSMRNVWAVGDLTGEPMLAHRAMAQGALVADVIAGETRTWDHLAIPAVCFTDPELLSVGLSPSDAKRDGVAVVVGISPFTANGRALTLGRDDGFVRVVAGADDGVVLGVQAVGAGVSELASAAATLVEMRATLRDVELIVHAHPTMGESIHDAAANAVSHR
jgi:dihydrolipoamide dehydrogenase